MEEIVTRLLGSADPCVRYLALRRALGVPPDSSRALEAREEVRTSQRVRLLLSERRRGRIPYHPYAKWYGAHWVLAVLAEVGYPAGDMSLVPLREQVYDWLNSKTHLGYQKEHETYAGPVEGVRGLFRAHASMEGNAVYYLNVLGLADDRTDALAERLARWQWPDGGWNCDKASSAHTSSFTESILPLRGLAVHLKSKSGYREVVDRAAEFFLERKLFRRKRDGRVIQPRFARLHFPCYWHYDILLGLKVMKEAGFLEDKRCSEAVSLLRMKRLPDLGYPAEEAYYKTGRSKSGRSTVSWGGVSSKRFNEFVTCDALGVLGSPANRRK